MTKELKEMAMFMGGIGLITVITFLIVGTLDRVTLYYWPEPCCCCETQ